VSAPRAASGGGVIKEFREFIARGNVVDLAVAVVIGAAFGRIVTSLVDGIILPPIGLLLGRVDFSSLFIVLDRSKGLPASLADAKAQGIPVVAYGAFLNEVLSFLIIAFAMFLLVKQANRLKAPPPPAATKTCPFCLSASVPTNATRCASCCADLPITRT
jgi:large conductance mechanosensitive channel